MLEVFFRYLLQTMSDFSLKYRLNYLKAFYKLLQPGELDLVLILSHSVWSWTCPVNFSGAPGVSCEGEWGVPASELNGIACRKGTLFQSIMEMLILYVWGSVYKALRTVLAT